MATNIGNAQAGHSNPLVQRAYALSGAEDAKELYNEWASTYDQDLDPEQYNSPQASVEAVIREIGTDGRQEIKILDAGCGTGIVGECLKKSKIFERCVIDGLDLTQGMLDVAKAKGVYRDLDVADLTKPIDRPDGSYDAVTCVGTLTKGHVGPAVFKEFARVATKGGIIVATVHDEIFEKNGYKSAVEELEASKIVQIVSTDRFDMFKNAYEPGRLVILRKA